MSFMENLGRRTLGGLRNASYLMGLLWAVARFAIQPRNWPRTTRAVLARQVLFTGVDALRFVGLVAVMTGISIVVQAQVWASKMGQLELLGPILVMVIVREAGPLLTSFVVIARSGAAISTELANMRVAGEVNVLDAQGVEPFGYLVVPRVLGVAISIFCLTLTFVIVSLTSGYVAGQLMRPGSSDPLIFFESVLLALRKADIYNLLAKTLATGLLTGGICCAEGLTIEGSITEVPQAATRAVVRSIAALFIVSAIVSILTYM